MWHEARKQEKKIRGLLVDYQRRAQRRKDYYEKIVIVYHRVVYLHNDLFLFFFRKLIRLNFYSCMADSVKFTLIQALQSLRIALLLCKHYTYSTLINFDILILCIRMPWQGNQEIMIDRFDARAHLDFIREPKKHDEDEVLSNEERQLNYERYRILVQNEFLTSMKFNITYLIIYC